MATLPLPEGLIDLWCVSLTAPPQPTAALQAYLSLDERVAAGRYQWPQHQRWAAHSRGMLRAILAQYLGCHPGDIPLTITRHGKPVLEGKATDWHFNLTHTEGMALYVVAHHPVGVDMEKRTWRPDPQLLCAICTKAEYRALQMLPAQQQGEASLRLWVKKEACFKAADAPNDTPFTQIEVGISEQTSSRPWQFLKVTPWPWYVAVVCCSSSFSSSLRRQQWLPEEVLL